MSDVKKQKETQKKETIAKLLSNFYMGSNVSENALYGREEFRNLLEEMTLEELKKAIVALNLERGITQNIQSIVKKLGREKAREILKQFVINSEEAIKKTPKVNDELSFIKAYKKRNSDESTAIDIILSGTHTSKKESLTTSKESEQPAVAPVSPTVSTQTSSPQVEAKKVNSNFVDYYVTTKRHPAPAEIDYRDVSALFAEPSSESVNVDKIKQNAADYEQKKQQQQQPVGTPVFSYPKNETPEFTVSEIRKKFEKQTSSRQAESIVEKQQASLVQETEEEELEQAIALSLQKPEKPAQKNQIDFDYELAYQLQLEEILEATTREYQRQMQITEDEKLAQQLQAEEIANARSETYDRQVAASFQNEEDAKLAQQLQDEELAKHLQEESQIADDRENEEDAALAHAHEVFNQVMQEEGGNEQNGNEQDQAIAQTTDATQQVTAESPCHLQIMTAQIMLVFITEQAIYLMQMAVYLTQVSNHPNGFFFHHQTHQSQSCAVEATVAAENNNRLSGEQVFQKIQRLT